MWNLFSVVVSHRYMVNWRRGCAFCYMWNLCGVVVLQRSIVDWGRYICPRYMCIFQYVKLIWCSGVPEICGQLEGGTSDLGICAFCCMWNLCGVMLFHRSMVDWRGVHLPWVYVNSAICETYSVQLYSIDLWSIGGGGLLYVKLIWCSSIP